MIKLSLLSCTNICDRARFIKLYERTKLELLQAEPNYIREQLNFELARLLHEPKFVLELNSLSYMNYLNLNFHESNRAVFASYCIREEFGSFTTLVFGNVHKLNHCSPLFLPWQITSLASNTSNRTKRKCFF